MKRYLVAAAVVVFWLNSMRQLIGREVLPAIREAAEAAQGVKYRDLRRTLFDKRRIRMGIFVQQHVAGEPQMRPVGELERNVHLTNPDGMQIVSHVRFDMASIMRKTATGAGLPTETTFHVHVARGKLVKMEMRTRLPGASSPLIEVHGRMAGDKLNLVIRSGGGSIRRVVPFDPNYLLEGMGSPLSGMPDLYVGKRWTIRTFNIMSAKVVHMQAHVARRETIKWLDEEVECYVVAMGKGALKSTAWVDDRGRLIRYRVMALSFVLKRPPSETSETHHD